MGCSDATLEITICNMKKVYCLTLQHMLERSIFFKKISDVHTVELEKKNLLRVRIPFHPLIDRPIYATNQASSTVLMET